MGNQLVLENVEPIIKDIIKEVPNAKTHPKALADIICRCNEEEASAICSMMAEKYPSIMMECLTERFTFLMTINNELKNTIKKL